MVRDLTEVRQEMPDENAPHTKRPILRIVHGGRRVQEERLLREFMYPGVDNFDRVQAISRSLAPRGNFHAVGTEEGGEDRR